jgi:hypothetical protein
MKNSPSGSASQGSKKMAFDQAKFEAHRALAERLKPKQQVYVLARELLMLCDEIARLQLLVKPMPEETEFRSYPNTQCNECDALFSAGRNYKCPKHVPQEHVPGFCPKHTIHYGTSGCPGCVVPVKSKTGEK